MNESNNQRQRFNNEVRKIENDFQCSTVDIIVSYDIDEKESGGLILYSVVESNVLAVSLRIRRVAAKLNFSSCRINTVPSKKQSCNEIDTEKK